MDNASNISKTKMARLGVLALVVATALMLVATISLFNSRVAKAAVNNAGHFKVSDFKAEDLKTGEFSFKITASDKAQMSFLLKSSGFVRSGKKTPSDALGRCQSLSMLGSKGKVGIRGFARLDDPPFPQGQRPTLVNLDENKLVGKYKGSGDDGIEMFNSGTITINNMMPAEHGEYICLELKGISFKKALVLETDDDGKYVFKTNAEYNTEYNTAAKLKRLFASMATGDEDAPTYTALDLDSGKKLSGDDKVDPKSPKVDVWQQYTFIAVKLDMQKPVNINISVKDLDLDTHKDDLEIKVSGSKYLLLPEDNGDWEYASIRDKDAQCNASIIDDEWVSHDKWVRDDEWAGIEQPTLNYTEDSVAYIMSYASKRKMRSSGKDKALCFRIRVRGDVYRRWVTNDKQNNNERYVYRSYPSSVAVTPVDPPIVKPGEAKLTVTAIEETRDEAKVKVFKASVDNTSLVDLKTIEYVLMPVADTRCAAVDFSNKAKENYYGNSIKKYDDTKKPEHKTDVDFCFRVKSTKATNAKSGYIYAHINNKSGTTVSPPGVPGTGDDPTVVVDPPVVDPPVVEPPVENKTPEIRWTSEDNQINLSSSTPDLEWAYVGPLSDAELGECGDDDFATDVQTLDESNLSINTEGAEGKVFCVRATDKIEGINAYKSISVSTDGGISSDPGTTTGIDPEDPAGDKDKDPVDEDSGSGIVWILIGGIVVIALIVVFVVAKKRQDV